jgi:hypothetical protein
VKFQGPTLAYHSTAKTVRYGFQPASLIEDLFKEANQPVAEPRKRCLFSLFGCWSSVPRSVWMSFDRRSCSFRRQVSRSEDKEAVQQCRQLPLTSRPTRHADRGSVSQVFGCATDENLAFQPSVCPFVSIYDAVCTYSHDTRSLPLSSTIDSTRINCMMSRSGRRRIRDARWEYDP